MPFYHVPLSIALSLLHLYIYKRLVRDTLPRGPWRRTLFVVFIVGDVCTAGALLLSTQIDPAISQWFAWPGYLWLGIFIYLGLTTLVLELPRLARALDRKSTRLNSSHVTTSRMPSSA